MTLAKAPIGVFDSGVGGLTVLKALLELLPGESTVYLGDTARVPYGTRSAEVVTQYALANARFLMRYDIKMLVVACNTASAVALEALSHALPIPVIGVIGPTARAAAALSKNGHIGVLGTPGTIRSGAYRRELESARPDVTVQSRACPLFVPLAEEGWTTGDVPRLVAEAYLEELKQSAVDTVVLGCTHYPLLRDIVQQVLGPAVTLVDAAEATVQTVRQTLSARGALSAEAQARHRFFVTDVPGRFAEVGERFLGQPIGEAEQVDIVFSSPAS